MRSRVGKYIMCGFAAALAAGGVKNVQAEENSSLTLYMSEEQEKYLYAAALEEFRAAWPEVELNVVSYGMDEMMTDPVKMKTELMAGGGADLLLFNCWGNDDVYKLLAAGVFAPLDGFMAPENGWQEEAYVTPIINGGQFHGTQYVMPLNYDVRLGLASQEGLSEIGFDLGACTDTLSLMKEVAALYDADYSERILADCAQFTAFPQHLGGEFLNYTEGEIGVDKSMLQEACEAYSRMYEEEMEYNFDDLRYFGYGQAIVERSAYVAVPIGIEGFLSTAVAIAGAETPVLLPFRTSDGEISAEIRMYAGIRANSENKQNAWNMLMILMNEEMQGALASYSSYVPVQRKALESAIENKLGKVMEEGRTLLEVGDLGAEFTEEYRNAFLSPGHSIFVSDLSVQKFFNTMTPFYTGDADYEECMEEFEDYVKIYLTE